MARPPEFRRPIVEEMPEDVREWMRPITEAYNRFAEEVTSILDKRLTFSENFSGQIREFNWEGTEVEVEVTGLGLLRPKVVMLGAIRDEQGNSVSLSGAITLNWDFSANTRNIKITQIAGLTASASQRYKITVLVIGE